uniref:VWFA domain-containing protein n=1 Tax=Knipowitschia caucasica TaxID=637954 RepID=A0AAV2ME40_KNICA
MQRSLRSRWGHAKVTEVTLGSCKVCRQEAVADLVFLVDGSWSIGTQNFEQIRRFLGSVVQSFDVGLDRVRVGLVQYSTMPRTEFYLNTYQDKAAIQAAIQALPYMGGGTHTGLGLDFLLDQAFTAEAGSRLSQKVPQVAVVITDGKSQDGVEDEARRLKERGVLLFAVGIKDADEEQLTAIAHGNVYSVHDFSALSDISLNIVHTLCTSVEEAQGLITQLSAGEGAASDLRALHQCRGGTGSDHTAVSSCQQVREQRLTSELCTSVEEAQGLITQLSAGEGAASDLRALHQCRGGTGSDHTAVQQVREQRLTSELCTSVEEAQGLITQLSAECTRASVADVVFLVDGSSSIGTENFEEMRSFLKTVVSGLDIGEDKVRVGLAQYSSDPVTEFLLKDHVDKQEVLRQLDRVPYRLGGTETGKALDFIRTKFFTTEAGSRLAQRVPQIAVVITDGDSTDQARDDTRDITTATRDN